MGSRLNLCRNLLNLLKKHDVILIAHTKIKITKNNQK